MLLGFVSLHAEDRPRIPIGTRHAVAIAESARTSIRVDSSLVLIPVTVTDANQRPLPSLSREAFQLFEGGAERKIVHFSREDAPVSVGIVFDCSESMGSKLKRSREAVGELFKAANPDDEFFLVEFSATARLAAPFTTQQEAIQSRLMAAESKGKTALLDAIRLAIDEMKHARNERRALIVISDGGDNHSRYSESEINNLVRESDVWIYAIGIYEHAIMLPEEEPAGAHLLTSLAEATGGRQLPITTARELPAAAEQIGLELRNQYILGFSLGDGEEDGKYHRVRVKLVQPRGLHVFSRPGYYSLDHQPLSLPSSKVE